MLRESVVVGAVAVLSAAALGEITFVGGAWDAPAVQFQPGQSYGGSLLAQHASRGTIAATETYTARLLGQSTTTAFGLHANRPVNHLFDGLVEASGNHAATLAPLSITEAIVPISANEFEVIVELSSDDSSDLLPAGLQGGNPAQAITVLRFDVGTAAAGVDPILYTSSDTHAYLYEAGLRVFVDGTNVFETVFGNFTPISSPGSIDLSQVWTLSGGAGAGIDAIQTFWRVRDVPTPGSLALVAAAGLVAIRRRR